MYKPKKLKPNDVILSENGASYNGIPYYFFLSPRLEKLDQRIEELEGKPELPVRIDKDRWMS